MELIKKQDLNVFCDYIRSITRIYLALSTVMFFAFASALVIQFHNIQARIRSASSSYSNTNDLLEKLNNHLFTTVEAISELANFFSIIFLLLVSCIFVQTISYTHLTFRVISGRQERKIYSMILTILDIIILMSILHTVCYKADEIKYEVRDIF